MLEITQYLPAVVLVIAIVLFVGLRSKTTFKHPPGPAAIPFLGHSEIVKNFTQLELSEWLAKQGPIVRLELNGKNWIGINSLEIANTFLVKNGNNFSSRPFIPLACDVIFRNSGIALMPYGDKWRKHRRLIHNSINPAIVNEMENLFKEEVDTMIDEIDKALKETDYLDICEFVYDYAFSVIVRFLFGRIPTSQNGEKRPFHIFRKLAHDSFMMVTSRKFNFYKFLPFGPNYSKSQLKQATDIQQRLDQFIETYLDEVRKQIDAGNADNSVASKFLQSQLKADKLDFEYKEFVTFLYNILLAATETVGDNLAWAIASITKHPEHQKIAQLQIDALKRDPTLHDDKELYYTQNIIKESLRMFPSNILNLPRENNEYFQYEGYDIPAKTTVILNLYAINRDPKRYPDPEKFDPTRFETNLPSSEIDPFSFGMGRRMCPGIHLAKSEIFCALVRILQKYELSENHEFPVVLSTDGRSVSHPPYPFKVYVKKRLA